MLITTTLPSLSPLPYPLEARSLKLGAWTTLVIELFAPDWQVLACWQLIIVGNVGWPNIRRRAERVSEKRAAHTDNHESYVIINVKF